jgi:uncharacterized protein
MKLIKKIFSSISSATENYPKSFVLMEILAILSSFIMIFISKSYLISMPEGAGGGDWLAIVFGLVTNTLLLNLILAIVLFIPIYFIRKNWLTFIVAPIFFFLFNIFIYADSVVYGLYRFHFNSMIWNLFTTEGASDSFTIGFETLAFASLIFFTIFLILYGSFYLVLLKTKWNKLSKKTIILSNLIIFFLIISSKILYAYGDVAGNLSITRSHNIVPFYVPLTMKRILRSTFDIKPVTSKNIKISSSGTLNYPREELKFTPNGRRPNIIMIFIEGARFDMLEPDVMPNLFEWSKSRTVSKNHFSGGNASRFGLFSGLYGIHATYWHTFLSEQKKSVLTSELEKMDYRFGIFSSTDLHFPELRQTAFLGMGDYIKDDFDCSHVERDIKITDEIISLMNQESDKPYFSFMFYDASHQPYRYPKEHEVFETNLDPDDINYITLASSKQEKWDSMRNRYKNSLHYIDEQLARLFLELENENRLDSTIILIAGDHGEAFGELGRHGHNNSFSRFQTKTLMVLNIPDFEEKTINHNTSHYDWLPTIFEFMEIKNPAQDYSQGQSMTKKTKRDYLLISCWDTAAMLFSDGIIKFGHYNGKSGMSAWSHDWKEISDPDGFYKKHIVDVGNFIEHDGRFIK